MVWVGRRRDGLGEGVMGWEKVVWVGRRWDGLGEGRMVLVCV